MHGITITKGPMDWEIVQQKDGFGSITLEGTFCVHEAAIAVGVEDAVPIVRVMREDDNEPVIPWTRMNHEKGASFTGSFSHTLSIPAGGLYRIETSLETKSTQPSLTWLYRGDCILHFGVGDLFLIAGQSNAAGFGKDYAFDPPDMLVHLFRNRSKWDLACHPMNESTYAGSLPNEEMGIPGMSPYLAFAKKLGKKAGYPIGLIQTAMGGSPMSRWMPETGDLYENLLDKIAQTKGQYAGVLWYQGCSDTEPELAPSYLERFSHMVKTLRGHLGYEIPFFTFQLNRFLFGEQDDCFGMVREAQRLAAKTLPGVYVLPTTNIPICDGIHNSAHGNLMLGERLANLCGHVLYGGDSFFAAELMESVWEEETLLCLTFANVGSCFCLFSSLGSESGFTIEDEEGTIEIETIRADRQDRNKIYLRTKRAAKKEVKLSFAWQANPVKQPPVDEITFLPPLSFYQVKIGKE